MKSENPLILCVICHHQNPTESTIHCSKNILRNKAKKLVVKLFAAQDIRVLFTVQQTLVYSIRSQCPNTAQENESGILFTAQETFPRLLDDAV
jgi:uncharacterized membrane protein